MSNLSPAPYHCADIPRALGFGWRDLRAMPGPSLLLALILALIATGLLLIPLALGTPALALILAGGFGLIGPLLLPPWLALRESWEVGRRPGLGLAWRGYQGAGVLGIAGFCFFLWLVWVTDAGLLYAFLVGTGTPPDLGVPAAVGAGAPSRVGTFILWSSLLGAGLAVGVHLIAAFAVPLLYEGRAQLIPAVHASVRAMFLSPGAALAWGLTLILGLMAGFLLPPLLLFNLPVLAYAHLYLYRRALPYPDEEAPTLGQPHAR